MWGVQGCKGGQRRERGGGVTQPLAVVLEPTGELLCGALGDGTLAQQPHLAKGVLGCARVCTGCKDVRQPHLAKGGARVCTSMHGDAKGR